MPDCSFTIGHLAKSAQVNVETVRYYQRRGLLQEPVRPLGGVRRYGRHDLARLVFVKRAQTMGFSLNEVAELLAAQAGQACDHTRQLLELKLSDVRRRVTELQALESELAKLLRDCLRVGDGDRCPTLQRLEQPRETSVLQSESR